MLDFPEELNTSKFNPKEGEGEKEENNEESGDKDKEE